jgi:hypothetical protein
VTLEVWRRFHDNTPVEVRGYVRPAVAEIQGFAVVTTSDPGPEWQRAVEGSSGWLRGRRPRAGDVYVLGPLAAGDQHEVRCAFAPHQLLIAERFVRMFAGV